MVKYKEFFHCLKTSSKSTNRLVIESISLFDKRGSIFVYYLSIFAFGYKHEFHRKKLFGSDILNHPTNVTCFICIFFIYLKCLIGRILTCGKG